MNNSKHKFEKLDKMDQFLKIYLKLSQLTQYEMNNLNGPIAIKKIEFIMK